MESALMTVPPRRQASSRPTPDLPLAVGPAIRTALIGTGGAYRSGDGHRNEAEPTLGVGNQQQHRLSARPPHRRDPGDDFPRIVHPLLGDLDNDIARFHVLLRRRAVRDDFGDHYALDGLADMELVAQLFGERGDREAEQLFMVGLLL